MILQPKFVKVFVLLFLVMGLSSAAIGSDAAQEKPTLRAARITFDFFYSPGCTSCQKTVNLIRREEEQYHGRLIIRWHNLDEQGAAGVQKYLTRLDQAGISASPPMSFFYKNNCLPGAAAIRKNLPTFILTALAHPEATQADNKIPAKESNRLGLWAVTLAALTDGVNPCAFTSLVFLMSLLAGAKRTRKEIALIGLTFALAVYLTYFTIGAFLFYTLRSLEALPVLARIIYWGAFLLCLICGGLSLSDAWTAFRGGKSGDIFLKLPRFLTLRLHTIMREGVRARSMVAGAFVMGVGVSLIESACTGQVYFPVIAGLLQDSATRSEGMLILLWYCAIFILPLLGVFIATLYGVPVERMIKLGRRQLGFTKLALAIIFFAMAAWLGLHLS